jgi:hypothetical protein
MTVSHAALAIVVTGMGVKWLGQNVQEDSVLIQMEHTLNHSKPSSWTDYVEKHVLHVL